MNDIKSFILQQFKETFPNFNWRIGSMVRELLVEPLAYLSELMDRYSTYLSNLNRLDYVLNNPEECILEIDSWMHKLNIQLPKQYPGSGKVAILLSSGQDFTVPGGAVFVWGDLSNVFVETDQKFSLRDGTMTEVCYGCYKAVVDVVTLQDSSISLSCGAPLTWTEAPAEVTDIYVESPITGGFGELSYSAKADMIRSVVTNPTPCGHDSILAGIQRRFPDLIADVITPINTGAERSGNVPLVVKQRAVPVTFDVKVAVEPIKYHDKTLLGVKVPRKRLMYVKEVHNKAGNALTFDVVDELADYNNIVILFPADVYPAVAVGDTVTVRSLQLSGSLECFNWLNSVQLGAPYTFVESVPAVAILSLDLVVNNNSRSVTETELIELQNYINDGKINHTMTDAAISAVLQPYGKSLARPVTYRGTVYYRGAAKSFCSSSGSLNLAALGVFPGVPVVAYTSADRIKVL